MKLATSFLLRIDRLFFLPCRFAEFCFESFTATRPRKDGVVVAIKLFGKGSLIQLFNLSRQLNSKTESFVLITSSSQTDVCKWMGVSNVVYIRTSGLIEFFADCLRAMKKVRNVQTEAVVSLERCSYACNTFSLLLSILTGSRNIFFETSRNFSTSKRAVYSAERFSIEGIFKKCLEELPQLISPFPKNQVAVDNKKIIVNINASDLLPARRYPAGQFAEVIKGLHHHNPDLNFFLTGSESEHDYNQNLIRQLNGVHVQNVAGQWTLEQLAKEIGSAAFLLTCDSMPLHMAAFLGVPAVVLWGPTQPAHFGYEKMTNIFSATRKLHCSPCFIHPASKPLKDCHGRIDCLLQLNPVEVTSICENVLEEGDSARFVNFPPKLK